MNHKEHILEIANKALEIAKVKNTVNLDAYEYDHIEIYDDCITVVFSYIHSPHDDEIWVDVDYSDFDKDLEDIKLETEKRNAIKAQSELLAKQKREFMDAENKLKVDRELYLKLKKQFE